MRRAQRASTQSTDRSVRWDLPEEHSSDDDLELDESNALLTFVQNIINTFCEWCWMALKFITPSFIYRFEEEEEDVACVLFSSLDDDETSRQKPPALNQNLQGSLNKHSFYYTDSYSDDSLSDSESDEEAEAAMQRRYIANMPAGFKTH